VRVLVGGRTDAAVSYPPLDNMRLNTCGEEKRGARVAEAVHGDPADARARDQPLQRRRDRVYVEWRPEPGRVAALTLPRQREDQAVVGVLLPVRKLQLRLLPLVLPEDRDRLCREVERPESPGLCRAEPRTTCAPTTEPSRDAESAGGQIDIGPAKPLQLASPRTTVQGDSQQRCSLGAPFFRRPEDLPCLLGGPRLDNIVIPEPLRS
jgi:hypothetical protein